MSLAQTNRVPLLSTAFVVLILLAGCTGGEAPPKSTAPPVNTEASHTAETGGIEGRVLNDEAYPISGADVGIQGPNNSVVRSDVNGRFAFSDLQPGEYKIIAQALGYKAGAKKVMVAVGQISQMNFTLESAPTAPLVQPNQLTSIRNTLYAHFGPSGTPGAWLDTEEKNKTATDKTDGYNPLVYAIGPEPGAAVWTFSPAPDLPLDVKLDTTKTIDIVVFIGACLTGADSGYITVTVELLNGETKVFSGAGKTSDYKGNLVEFKWSETPAVAQLVAESGLTWNIRATGATSQICVGAYSEALTRMVFPVVDA